MTWARDRGYLVGVRSHGGRGPKEVMDVAEDDVAGEAVAGEPVLLNSGHGEDEDFGWGRCDQST